MNDGYKWRLKLTVNSCTEDKRKSFFTSKIGKNEKYYYLGPRIEKYILSHPIGESVNG